MEPGSPIAPRSASGYTGGETTPLRGAPPPQSLPSASTGKRKIDTSNTTAPKGSALDVTIRTIIKTTIGDLIIGISAKDLKDNIKKAWKADKKLPIPIRLLKGAARMTGLALGLFINFASRIVAFAVAAAVAPIVMVGYTLATLVSLTQSSIWKNPRGVLLIMAGLGSGAGAAAGAVIGSIGNLCIKTAISMEYDEGETVFNKAMGDSIAAGLVGGLLGAAISCVNPLFIRAIWIPDTDF